MAWQLLSAPTPDYDGAKALAGLTDDAFTRLRQGCEQLRTRVQQERRDLVRKISALCPAKPAAASP
jgi:hypothetical protein